MTEVAGGGAHLKNIARVRLFFAPGRDLGRSGIADMCPWRRFEGRMDPVVRSCDWARAHVLLGGAQSLEGGDLQMPIYVFRCAGGHDFEKLVPMSAAAPDCPNCGNSARKMPTTFGIRSSSSSPKAPRKFSSSALWREAFKDQPEKVKREVEFRQQLAAKGTRESHDIPSPDRNLTGGVILD